MRSRGRRWLEPAAAAAAAAPAEVVGAVVEVLSMGSGGVESEGAGTSHPLVSVLGESVASSGVNG